MPLCLEDEMEYPEYCRAEPGEVCPDCDATEENGKACKARKLGPAPVRYLELVLRDRKSGEIIE